MARIPKPKKKKERKPQILHVPLTPIPLDRGEEQLCDRCRQVPEDPDAALFCVGVTEALTLGLSHHCPPCFDVVEWGYVYAPHPELGAPCMPLGES